MPNICADNGTIGEPLAGGAALSRPDKDVESAAHHDETCRLAEANFNFHGSARSPCESIHQAPSVKGRTWPKVRLIISLLPFCLIVF